jgi:hypothetical protein
MRMLILALFVSLGLPGGGEDILKKVEAVFSAVEDYTVTLDVTTDIERLKIPPMHLTMYYKQPDKVHFDTEGFALLPREGLALPFSRLSQRFLVDSVQKYTEGSIELERLVLRSRDERARLRKAVLYVHPQRWTPEKIIAQMPDGSTMTAAFQYERIAEHWMPVQLHVEFVAARRDTVAPSTPAGESPFGEPPASRTRFTPPRAGSITVHYSEYRINTGLSDDIFTNKKK